MRLGPSLTGVLWQYPARDPVTLRAVADIGGLQSAVSISVDSAWLISGLLLTPYQPPPASWAQVDQDLGALAPDASLLAARVSPGELHPGAPGGRVDRPAAGLDVQAVRPGRARAPDHRLVRFPGTRN